MKKSIQSIALLFICFSIYLVACHKNDCNGTVEATIKDLKGLDGCGFVIELNNGDYLEPTNLTDFAINIQDGQKVWISYSPNTQMMSICMVGQIVDIDSICPR